MTRCLSVVQCAELCDNCIKAHMEYEARVKSEAIAAAVRLLEANGYSVSKMHPAMPRVDVFTDLKSMKPDRLEKFYRHFRTDDWSYIVITTDESAARLTANVLDWTAVDSIYCKIDDEHWVVTYHS